MLFSDNHYVSILGGLGYRNIEYLGGRKHALVFFGEREGEMRTMKLPLHALDPRRTQEGGNFEGRKNYVTNEARVLERARDVYGVIQMTEFKEVDLAPRWLTVLRARSAGDTSDLSQTVLLEKRHVPGQTLQDTHLSAEGHLLLRQTMLALHAREIAGFGFDPRDVLIDKEGAPWLTDLGSAYLLDGSHPQDYAAGRQKDGNELSALRCLVRS